MTKTAALLGLGLAIAFSGCARKGAGPTTRPLTAAERSDKALKDPFRYSPDWSGTDVSGGGDADLDAKGLQRDLGHVIMP